MQHIALATRYRPQTFADVTGQDMVKAILSRAAETDSVGPAYLLSGTRGVGKTTLARVFAKALNCVNAPTAEPCNVCDQCKRIMQGNHVDVLEIDGASNRGIDDARRLREVVAYAPMEGRYKVIIIDEAHMLTRESFNALLKTLEEPPPRTTFILATTEAHKFPVTIISRCQHFTLKALTEDALTGHLQRILHAENITSDAPALRLLARRAAGSVRDGMSLLSQVIALGEGDVTEAAVRSLLGLAGHEAYERILKAIQARSCIDVVTLSQELLERGLDIGFFLRELALLWRNLLLLHEAGDGAAKVIDMPEADIHRLQALAKQFDRAYIHAAWHMVLEHQRQILQSLEPATALELLLINLVLLSDLVSLEHLSRVERLTRPLATGKTADPVAQVTQMAEKPASQLAERPISQIAQATEQSANPSSQVGNTPQAQATEQMPNHTKQAATTPQSMASSFAEGTAKLQSEEGTPPQTVSPQTVSPPLARSANTEQGTEPNTELGADRSNPTEIAQGTMQSAHHEALSTQNIEQETQDTQGAAQHSTQHSTQQAAQHSTQQATQSFTLEEHNEIAASLPATHLEYPLDSTDQPAMPQDIEELVNAATARIPQQATKPRGFGNMLNTAVDIETPLPTPSEQGEENGQNGLNERGEAPQQDLSAQGSFGQDSFWQEANNRTASETSNNDTRTNTEFNPLATNASDTNGAANATDTSNEAGASNANGAPNANDTPNEAGATGANKQISPETSPQTPLTTKAPPPYKVQTEGQLKTQMQDHPTVQAIKETFDASLLRCYQKKP